MAGARAWILDLLDAERSRCGCRWRRAWSKAVFFELPSELARRQNM